MKKLYLLWCLFLFACNTTHAEQERSTGSLIVTYKTDMKGERLDRIRFWLKEQNEKKQTLFPKGKSFVEDSKDPSRMVVIEELAPGNYTLQFLIPNIDSYFEEVPEREVIISANEIVKIDQKIKALTNFPSRISASREGSDGSFFDEGITLAISEEKSAPDDSLAGGRKLIGKVVKAEIKPIEKRSHATPPPIASLSSAEIEQDPETSEDENLYTDEEAEMTALGELTIYSNIPEAQGLIFNIEYPENRFPVEIQDGEAVIYLPGGEYRIVFDRASVERTLPLPIEIKIDPLHKRTVNAYFGLNKEIAQ